MKGYRPYTLTEKYYGMNNTSKQFAAVVVAVVIKVSKALMNTTMSLANKDVFGVTVEDRHHLLVADENGNMKGKKLFSDEKFDFFRVPVIVKPDGVKTIYDLAKAKALDIAPKRVEKRVDRNRSKHGALAFYYKSDSVVMDAVVDVEYEERESLLNFLRSNKRNRLSRHERRVERAKLRKLSEDIIESYDDKAEAYQALGFTDIPYQSYDFKPMPIYWSKPVDFVNPEVKRIIDTYSDGKEQVYQSYYLGQLDWDDVKAFLDPKLSISYRAMSMSDDYDKFYRQDKRAAKARRRFALEQ